MFRTSQPVTTVLISASRHFLNRKADSTLSTAACRHSFSALVLWCSMIIPGREASSGKPHATAAEINEPGISDSTDAYAIGTKLPKGNLIGSTNAADGGRIELILIRLVLPIPAIFNALSNAFRSDSPSAHPDTRKYLSGNPNSVNLRPLRVRACKRSFLLYSAGRASFLQLCSRWLGVRISNG